MTQQIQGSIGLAIDGNPFDASPLATLSISPAVPILESIALSATTSTQVWTGTSEDKSVISASPGVLNSLGVSNVNGAYK